jgi:hypothetical protein
MNYFMPSRFDESSLGKIGELLELHSEPELILDFSRVTFVHPFPTVVIATALRELMEERRSNGLKTLARGTDLHSGAISYLRYFGFFKALGYPVGNAPNEATGGARYIPMTIIRRSNLENSSENEPIQKVIDRNADRLAAVAFPGNAYAGPAMMLSYCLREIIRNSFEHAMVNRCIVMGQRWDDGTAEITIGDRGIGVFDNLSRTHSHLISSVDDAIRAALLPGITSGAARATGSEWDNSGFGLFVVSELGKRYGNFSMISSGRLLRPGAANDKGSDIPIMGTIVQLRINTNDGDYFPNILEQIVADGERQANHIEGAIVAASKMSKSVSMSPTTTKPL